MSEFIPNMTGYKATGPDMVCTPPSGPSFQFELGKWYEVDGDPVLCKKGFHFCPELAGVWCYYPSSDTRVFKVEAEQVLVTPDNPGSSNKKVAKRIRLIEEVSFSDSRQNTGDQNTGYRNTGDQNTGNGNTGHRNTGDWNSGNGNTGHRNTGDWNSGNGNTGHRNTGDWNSGYGNTGNKNTGNWNTGNRNTGDENTGYRNSGNRNTGNWNTGNGNTGNWNTGNRNTGYRNSGDGNTGNWNAANRCSGCFCVEDPPLIVFDEPCDLSFDELVQTEAYGRLVLALTEDDPIDFESVKGVPNITPEKLERLHQKLIESRRNNG